MTGSVKRPGREVIYHGVDAEGTAVRQCLKGIGARKKKYIIKRTEQKSMKM